MANYKIRFEGFAYVEADSAEEAETKFDRDEVIYAESVRFGTEQVEDCVVEVDT